MALAPLNSTGTAPASQPAASAQPKHDSLLGDIEQGLDSVKQTASNVVNTVKDGFINAGGAAIGELEMMGLKYPVHEYSAKVDDGLTRGSRLTDPEFAQLKAEGFRSTVNLCAENNDDAPRAAADGMNSLHLPIIDNTPPTEQQMKQFLDFATNPANRPCYVHCEAGVGRTGTAVACYRMAVQGWTPDQAIAEAKKYHMAMPDQEAFLRQFGADLSNGKIVGYPLPPGALTDTPPAAQQERTAAMFGLKAQ